jgi:hypothetical protein
MTACLGEGVVDGYGPAVANIRGLGYSSHMTKMRWMWCAGLFFFGPGCSRVDGDGDGGTTETSESATTSSGATETTDGSTTGTETSTGETTETETGTTTTTESTTESGTDTTDESTDTTDDGNIEYCATLDLQECWQDELCYEVIACKIEWYNEPTTWCCNGPIFVGCQSKQQTDCGDIWFCKDGEIFSISNWFCIPPDSGFEECEPPPGMKHPEAC